MSTYFYKQTWAFPEGAVVTSRSRRGGSVKSAGSILSQYSQMPVFGSFEELKRPVFVLSPKGYVAVRGKITAPEENSLNDDDFVYL